MLNHSNRAVRRTTPGNNIGTSLRIFKCYAWVTRSRKEHRVRRVAVASVMHLIDFIHDTRYLYTRIRIHGILPCHLGRFPFSQNFRNFRFGGKWNTFRRFFPLKNSQKKWKIIRDGTVFPNGISCSIYPFLVVCTSSRRPRSGTATYRGLRPNGTTFYQSEIPLLLPPKFPLFFLNGKRPRHFRSDKICQYELSRKSLCILSKPDDNLKAIQGHS